MLKFQDVVVGDTIREPDGLAMSSRNVYLSEEERRIAPMLYNAMKVAAKAYNDSGVRDRSELIFLMDTFLEQLNMHAQYWSIADPVSLRELEHINPNTGAILSGAILIGKTRIIDNILLGVHSNKL